MSSISSAERKTACVYVGQIKLAERYVHIIGYTTVGPLLVDPSMKIEKNAGYGPSKIITSL